MAAAVDLRRRAPAKRVSADKWDELEPGDCVIVTRRDGSGVSGYAHACPGCGETSALNIEPRDGHPVWSVAGGDPAHPEGVTLSPSILHDPVKGGCGWHGYLRNGVFEPC